VTRYRGTVWWGPAPQKATPSYRPWLVLSTDDHPFAASECIAVAMTTTRHDAGIIVSDDDWVEGGADSESYVSPWYVATFKYADLDRRQGRVAEDVVRRAAAELHAYTPERFRSNEEE
jgi:mRNA-degrading endonuclease toxin of MazEF toxin-antitoxin module